MFPPNPAVLPFEPPCILSSSSTFCPYHTDYSKSISSYASRRQRPSLAHPSPNAAPNDRHEQFPAAFPQTNVRTDSSTAATRGVCRIPSFAVWPVHELACGGKIFVSSLYSWALCVTGNNWDQACPSQRQHGGPAAEHGHLIKFSHRRGHHRHPAIQRGLRHSALEDKGSVMYSTWPLTINSPFPVVIITQEYQFYV